MCQIGAHYPQPFKRFDNDTIFTNFLDFSNVGPKSLFRFGNTNTLEAELALFDLILSNCEYRNPDRKKDY